MNYFVQIVHFSRIGLDGEPQSEMLADPQNTIEEARAFADEALKLYPKGNSYRLYDVEGFPLDDWGNRLPQPRFNDAGQNVFS